MPQIMVYVLEDVIQSKFMPVLSFECGFSDHGSQLDWELLELRKGPSWHVRAWAKW